MALDEDFKLLNIYLQRTEMIFMEENGIQGWETFLSNTRRSIFASGMLLFGMSFVATVAVACYKCLA